MTRAEFDAATREDWGGRWMASDERRSYRARRMRSADPGDYLGWRHRHRRCECAVLAVGSPLRTLAVYRRRHGMQLTAPSAGYPS